MLARVSAPETVPAVSFVRINGTSVKLSELIGQKVLVLFFYPKDDTLGCTAEACSFREQYGDFKRAGAEVFGVSADDGASHQAFEEKYHLPFTLLSDPGGVAAKALGVKKSLGLFAGRVTFVIDKEGVIRHRFDSQVQVHQHVSRALEVVRSLSGT